MPVSLSTEMPPDQIVVPDQTHFADWAAHVDDFFYIREVGGQVLYGSPAYERIWGRSLESLYLDPYSWRESVHPEDRDRIVQASQSLSGFQDDYRIVRPGGELRWIRSRSYPVLGDRGEVLRMVGFAEDITEWKRLEQQLVQSQKMDAVGRLAGGIAHDFNNLLTVINGYSAMIKDRSDLPDGLREDIDNVFKAGNRAAKLTSQLLAFSRQQPLKLKTVELGAAVKEVEPILRRLIREDVELSILPSPRPLCVCADPTQFEQVLLNLVINARDAISGRGTITIELSEVYFDQARALMHPGCKPGHYAMIAVTDDGCGMDAETQERIFEPFFTTKPPGQGTGLGLSTVYGVVKQSNGTVWVYSEVGLGTTFRVYLPADPTPAQEEQTPVSPVPIGEVSGTVLIVEDDEQVRSIAEAVLKARGYEVLSAANGEQAFALRERLGSSIDLLVTDVIMPKMGGPELVAKLVPFNPHMRVLYISGYTEHAVISPSSIPGLVQHLPKPFTPGVLARKVSDMLRKA